MELVLVNGQGLTETYGWTLEEGNYPQLLRAPKLKPSYTYSWPNADGEDYDPTAVPAKECQDFTLSFLIVAETKEELLVKYESFMNVLLDPAGTDWYFVEVSKSFKLHFVDTVSWTDIDLYGGSARVEVMLRNRHVGSDFIPWYGVEWNVNTANPAVTRVGNLDWHKSLPVQSLMRRCLLLDDGFVNYYLDSSDSTMKEDGTPALLDGTDGQVMVEIPEHYVKFETEGDMMRVLMSMYKVVGFSRVPKSYVSAFEATVHRPTNRLSSVVNLSAEYRGGNNNAGWDEEDRSLLGKPATAISRTNFRNYARNRGSIKWNCMLHSVRKSLFWLYVVEYANRNSQLAYEGVLSPDGYRQGGLGEGVTTVTSANWSSFNRSYPLVPCGVTLGLGNNTGLVPYEVVGFPVATTFQVPSYRGVENIFGHIWEWTDGVNVRVQSNVGGGESQVFVATGLDFSDSNYLGYQYVGLQARNSHYARNIIFGMTGEIIPSLATGAAAGTYWCDYNYSSLPGSGEALRGVLSGGNANRGAFAGLACSNTSHAPSSTFANVGSRLCYIKD